MADGMAPLHAGLETLARSFGDVLYVRMGPKGLDLKCPACGEFAVVRDFGNRLSGRRRYLLCVRLGDCPAKSKRPFVLGWSPKYGWCGFTTESLLALDVEELHLDGPWNPAGRIRRADLAARYETFQNERKDHVDP